VALLHHLNILPLRLELGINLLLTAVRRNGLLFVNACEARLFEHSEQQFVAGGFQNQCLADIAVVSEREFQLHLSCIAIKEPEIFGDRASLEIG